MEIRAFRALRPTPSLARRIACVPYDVVDRDEARALAAREPLSFLHVTRPEVDLPDEVPADDDRVRARGRAALERLVGRGALVREAAPCLYVYRVRGSEGSQTGLVAAFSLEEYEQGVVARHEHTRPDKEAERRRHLLAVGAQTGPVFLVHEPNAALQALTHATTQTPPLLVVEDEEGAEHALWRVEDVDPWRAAYADVARAVIADGHHRAAAAASARREREAAGAGAEDDAARHLLAVAFPSDEVHILGYHRVVLDLGDADEAAVARALAPRLGPAVEPARAPAPGEDVLCRLPGGWHALRLEAPTGQEPTAGLAVERLQEQVLGPLLGIEDPRRDPRLAFLGGRRAMARLEEAVAGGAAMAFALPPIDVETLLAVAAAGGTMPPKSTWFQPKLRSGLVALPLDGAVA